ncbi:MAG: hypothetical protein M5U22_02210 [Thermoleophilia bacterium]|nr:hypothetical protein [Thermoleophilia bacterium]
MALLILAGHYLRSFAPPFMVLYLLLPVLLLVRRSWAVRVVQAALFFGSLEWVISALSLVGERRALREPYGRAAGILAGVAAFTVLAAMLLETAGPRHRYGLRTGRFFQTAPKDTD